jgi:hypothetical protein
MRRAQRTFLAALITLCSAGVLAAVLAGPVAARDHPKCTPKPACATPTPDPTEPGTAAATPSAAKPSYPVAGSVQALVAPTPPLHEDPHATPGPVVGTLVTPAGQQVVPVSAPVITGQQQQQTGLEVLLVVAAVLALLTLGAITLAVVVR